jgi:hypothetical protein
MDAMQILNLEAVDAAELKTEPFDHVVVPRFVRPDALAASQADFPPFEKPGSIPLGQLKYGPGFRDLIDALDGPEFEDSISRKFNVDLTGRPTMFTVRARCRSTDGKIHTDSVTKIITVLLYLNDESWQSQGGRLRLLRSPRLDDYAAEVPPDGGTLLVFHRSDRSYHGHEPYEGPRRAIQMNWVTSQRVVIREQFRHRVSTFFKKLAPAPAKVLASAVA